MVGLYNHVHSWDRPFDHADFYPYYTLAADLDVPVAMQSGTSGGLMPSECGRPIGIDRPAIYFRNVHFVLSHTGWPWVDEAIAMALKFPNVFLGTAAYPPKHWAPAVRRLPAWPRAVEDAVRHQLPDRRAPPRARAARRARPETGDA